MLYSGLNLSVSNTGDVPIHDQRAIVEESDGVNVHARICAFFQFIFEKWEINVPYLLIFGPYLQCTSWRRKRIVHTSIHS
jgi:hypothetical protein